MKASLHFVLPGLVVALFAAVATARAADDTNAFGQEAPSEAALIGVLYDLKQTPDHQPTAVGVNNYFGIVDEFLSKHWDESVLNRYYRVSKPLYTTQIFIPQMSADNAPRAFGAEKQVKPSRWIIHYKGQVSPPSAGTYRFVGCSDDLICVGVNGKTVLVHKMGGNKPNELVNWQPSAPDGPHVAGNPLRHGDWITLKEGEIVDLDVIIGERPGGQFNAFLLVEKQGETYEQDEHGNLILPIFQVAPFDTPPVGDPRHGPRFAKSTTTWKSYQ